MTAPSHYLPAAVERTCSLLRSLDDTSTPTAGDWTVGDMAAHMIGGGHTYAAYAQGEPSVASSPADLAAMNAARLAAVATREGPALADLLAAAEGEFLDAIEGLAGDALVNWHFGLTMTATTAAAIRLVEHLVHGWDMARALDRPWPLPDDVSAAAVAGVAPMFPLFVLGDPGATVSFRPAGGEPLTLGTPGPPQAVVSGPAGDVLLLLYRRVDVGDAGVALDLSGDAAALSRFWAATRNP